VEIFSDQYLKLRWKDWKRARTQLRNHAVPSLGSRKLSQITRADLAALYHRLGIVSVYQRYDYEVEKRLALNLWAEHIAKLHTDLDAQMSATSLTPTSRSTSENVITR
jgi:hypothetical protein